MGECDDANVESIEGESVIKCRAAVSDSLLQINRKSFRNSSPPGSGEWPGDGPDSAASRACAQTRSKDSDISFLVPGHLPTHSLSFRAASDR